MVKAVIVMNLDEFPKDCSNCPQEWESDCNGRAYCAGTGDDQHEIDGDAFNRRPDWCPLIPEPTRLTGMLNDTESDAYICGWNACLDALEGK